MDLLEDRNRLLDLPKLSGYSSMSVSSLRDYIKSGALPSFKLRGKILVRISEFDAWIEGYRDKKIIGLVDTLLKGKK